MKKTVKRPGEPNETPAVSELPNGSQVLHDLEKIVDSPHTLGNISMSEEQKRELLGYIRRAQREFGQVLEGATTIFNNDGREFHEGLPSVVQALEREGVNRSIIPLALGMYFSDELHKAQEDPLYRRVGKAIAKPFVATYDAIRYNHHLGEIIALGALVSVVVVGLGGVVCFEEKSRKRAAAEHTYKQTAETLNQTYVGMQPGNYSVDTLTTTIQEHVSAFETLGELYDIPTHDQNTAIKGFSKFLVENEFSVAGAVGIVEHLALLPEDHRIDDIMNAARDYILVAGEREPRLVNARENLARSYEDNMTPKQNVDAALQLYR